MISTIFVMLFQAVAGAPAAPAPATAPETAPAEAAAPAVSEPAAPAVEPEEADDPNRLICRNVSVVGSRMPIRQCRTAAAEEENRTASRKWIDRAQSRMPTNAN